jgi:hypothetical protein
MSKKHIDTETPIRDERLVETDPSAFRILSKEESEKRRKEAREKRKKAAANTKPAK